MPFTRKTAEEACSNNNRKKNRMNGTASPTAFFCSPRNKKDREGERARLRAEKTTGKGKSSPPSDSAARSFASRPLQGHHSPSPKQPGRRVRHASSDHFSFSPPIETTPLPSARKAAGMHLPAASGVRSIREYLTNSLRNGKSGGVCCASAATESQTPSSVVSSVCEGGGPFARQINVSRDSTLLSSKAPPGSGDSFCQNLDPKDDWYGEDTQMESLLSGFRKCPTPDILVSTPRVHCPRSIQDPNVPLSPSPVADQFVSSPRLAVSHSAYPCYRRGLDLYGHSQVKKRCQYLEAEVEYLRDREVELRDRVAQTQVENTRLSAEMEALEENYREALAAKRKAQEDCSDHQRSVNRLQAAYNKRTQDLKELKTTLEQEREHWSESIEHMQDELEREKQRCALYKASARRTSVFDTTDTDISLNDYFEDGSTPSVSDFQAGNLSSSANNSPGISPRTLDDLRVENKRLLDENKRLREECEELESCRKICQQRHKLDMLKQDGNKAFQAGSYEEALQCYAAAFDEVGDDSRMQAVLHCNRAAALYNMERYLGAITSCCCAIDCDESYLRAYQRRASAYEAVGDFSSAADDITYLINSGSSTNVSREAQLHLTELQRKLKRSRPIDAYKILGLGMAATGAEIKSQYRKLALQFHPDKAQDRAGAAEAFRLVSQAHAMLSDETQRKKLDASFSRSNRSSPVQRQRS